MALTNNLLPLLSIILIAFPAATSVSSFNNCVAHAADCVRGATAAMRRRAGGAGPEVVFAEHGHDHQDVACEFAASLVSCAEGEELFSPCWSELEVELWKANVLKEYDRKYVPSSLLFPFSHKRIIDFFFEVREDAHGVEGGPEAVPGGAGNNFLIPCEYVNYFAVTHAIYLSTVHLFL